MTFGPKTLGEAIISIWKTLARKKIVLIPPRRAGTGRGLSPNLSP